MERRFSVEAKAFSFSVKVDVFEIRLAERRKGFVVLFFWASSVLCGCWPQ
jgi:hypothetical protein